jgi:anti-anti-sigma factor
VVTASISGDIDMLTAVRLQASLIDAIDFHQPRVLIIDIAAVAFVDAAGMTALVRTRLHNRQVKVRLVNAQPLVAKSLAIVGLAVPLLES